MTAADRIARIDAIGAVARTANRLLTAPRDADREAERAGHLAVKSELLAELEADDPLIGGER